MSTCNTCDAFVPNDDTEWGECRWLPPDPSRATPGQRITAPAEFRKCLRTWWCMQHPDLRPVLKVEIDDVGL